jgi:hypothetical protein
MFYNLQFILVPLLASLVLLTLTSYFGIHVLKREIIFIDIALAQITVLGSAMALYLEHSFHIHEVMLGSINLSDTLAYVFSLLFCMGAALIFTFLKNPKIKIPIEAFIGIAYALATTAAVIILDKGARRGCPPARHADRDFTLDKLATASSAGPCFPAGGWISCHVPEEVCSAYGFLHGPNIAHETTEALGFPVLFQFWCHDH